MANKYERVSTGRSFGIEATIKERGLPVNSIAMLYRLKEILGEYGTNCLQSDKLRNDVRVRGVLWLLNQQVHGQLGKIDMHEEYLFIIDRMP